jgi:hypothetical protein
MSRGWRTAGWSRVRQSPAKWDLHGELIIASFLLKTSVDWSYIAAVWHPGSTRSSRPCRESLLSSRRCKKLSSYYCHGRFQYRCGE